MVQTVREVFTPCEVLCKCLGLLPLYFHTKLKLWQKAANGAHFLLNINMLICALKICVPHDLKSESISLVLNQSFVLVIVMNYVHPFLCTVLCAAMSGKINLILTAIEAIDSKLKALNTEVNFQMYRRFAVFLVHVSTIPIFLLLVIYWAVARATDIIYVFAATFISFHYFVVVSLDVILVGVLSKQFRAIGEALRRMYFPTTPTSGGFLTTTAPGHTAETAVCSEKEQLTVLRQIKILHDKLNDVVELVNYCFSVQITFCVGLCFVIGVVCSFGLFRAFIYRNELFYMGVLNFIWYMYYLFFVLFFIAVGSKITREGKRIGVLVHKAINCSTSTAVINELNIFSQQLLHRSPVITCGLFVYDWTLLYTMIGATATYLIILIQFDVSFPNLVNVNGTATSPGV
ncbi:gustatory receptor for sugar taste 43a isoform X6 [Culex quinquefasciatus]|uniref:gustatory receptor for sugar taste 43a isoform X6 n=1 Tax=Culex quinquefasciatus TaxID=7176 RepID=UPI0018E3E67F|nr:gustatory receptor for sugar taste 43a isoform X6 [Culex quinquefasciatus]